jgi:hypothetical protein
MEWIECVGCEKFWCYFVSRTCALMALVRPVLHRHSCSNKTVRNARNTWVLGQMDRIRCVHCKKFRCNFVQRTCVLIALVRPVLHRVSCSKETVQNAQKHEFWVKWSGLDAFVATNSDATSFWWTWVLMALVRPILHRLSCSNEMVRNAVNHEFWVKWSGSSAFVAKNSDTTSFSEFVW